MAMYIAMLIFFFKICHTQKITLRTKLSNFITVGFSPHSCVHAGFCLQAQVTCLHLHSLLQQLVQARLCAIVHLTIAKLTYSCLFIPQEIL